MFPAAIVNSPMFGIGLSVIIYTFCEVLIAKLRIKYVPPIILSCPIVILLILHGPQDAYKAYNAGAKFLSFLLGTAIIALALPLYRNRELIRRNALVIAASIFYGTVVSIVAVYSLGKITGLSEQILLSLLPKSVTIPIAIEVSQALGGLPPITIAVVLCSGISGAALNHKLLHLTHIESDLACGLAIGLSSHALGTSACAKVSNVQLAVGGVAMGLTGVATTILAPFIVHFLQAL